MLRGALPCVLDKAAEVKQQSIVALYQETPQHNNVEILRDRRQMFARLTLKPTPNLTSQNAASPLFPGKARTEAKTGRELDKTPPSGGTRVQDRQRALPPRCETGWRAWFVHGEVRARELSHDF